MLYHTLFCQWQTTNTNCFQLIILIFINTLPSLTVLNIYRIILLKNIGPQFQFGFLCRACDLLQTLIATRTHRPTRTCAHKNQFLLFTPLNPSKCQKAYNSLGNFKWIVVLLMQTNKIFALVVHHIIIYKEMVHRFIHAILSLRNLGHQMLAFICVAVKIIFQLIVCLQIQVLYALMSDSSVSEKTQYDADISLEYIEGA